MQKTRRFRRALLTGAVATVGVLGGTGRVRVGDRDRVHRVARRRARHDRGSTFDLTIGGAG